MRRLEWVLDPVSYLERTKASTPRISLKKSSSGFGEGATVIASHPEAMQ